MSLDYTKKKMAKDRLRFFIYEISISLIFIFLLMIIVWGLFTFIVNIDSIFFGPLFYLIRALMTFFAIPLVLLLSYKFLLGSESRNTILEQDISPSIGHLRLYKITKNNYKYQIIDGILIFFLVFLPIDFLTYILIPEIIEYQASALSLYAQNSYLLLDNYFLFLISVIIIQISISISEETICRGLLTKRGSEHFHKMSAVIISSLYFGLCSFTYYFEPFSRFYPFWFPFIWFLEAFIIGLILSLILLRKKWILPAIFAHSLNNIISIHTIWNFLQGNEFIVVFLYLYLPLLIISCIIFIWQLPRIKKSVSLGFKIFKTYFKNDDLVPEFNNNKFFRIFIDLLIAILVFLMSFLITI